MSGKQSSKVFNFVIHLSPAIVLSSSFPIHPVLFTSFLSEFHFLLCFILLFKESGLFNLPTPQKRICLMQNCWWYVVGFQETDSKSWGHRVLHLSERNDERPL